MRNALLLTLLLACVDGNKVCTEIGCLDGLRIMLDPALDTAGEYRFELELDGDSVICTTTLPFDEENLGGCDDERVILSLSGTALPEDEQELPEIMITPDTPDAVSLTIFRDEAEIASESWTPSYVESQPNGEGCPPICHSASVTLSL